MVASIQGGGGGVQAAGFLQGPIRLKTSNDYGVTLIGKMRFPGAERHAVHRYLDLGIDAATGRAVDAKAYPLTTASAGRCADRIRVTHVIGNTAGGPDYVLKKYSACRLIFRS